MGHTLRQHPRQALESMFRAALAAVNGRSVVHRHLAAEPLSGAVAVVAVGKAAAAMLAGARDALQQQLSSALLVTKPGHFDPDLQRDKRITCMAGGHPLPDAHSLAAGDRLLRLLAGLPPGQPLLMLLSGGASSLLEVPRAGVDLEMLRRANRWLLGSGLDIRAMNRVRQRLSAIKGGRLRAWLAGRPASVLLISDVPDDDPAIIGSGPLYPDTDAAAGLPAVPDWLALPPAETHLAPGTAVPHRVLAGCAMALQGGAAHARALGYTATCGPEALAGPAVAAGERIARQLCSAAPGAYLWGGETTVVLPEQPGRGGRNQQLALAAARVLQGRQDILLLAAGTDGNDGNTPAAGAIVDGATVDRAAAAGEPADSALRRADAASCLAAAGAVLTTGPTGTNVMDLVIGLKLEH